MLPNHAPKKTPSEAFNANANPLLIAAIGEQSELLKLRTILGAVSWMYPHSRIRPLSIRFIRLGIVCNV
jgi:hypothetical protein